MGSSLQLDYFNYKEEQYPGIDKTGFTHFDLEFVSPDLNFQIGMDIREQTGYENISDILQDVKDRKEITSGATSMNCEILLLHGMQKLSTEMSNPKVHTYKDLKHRQFKERGNVNALLAKAIKEKYSEVC